MSAEIINFPERGRDRRLTAGLEQLAREIEGLLTRAEPGADIGKLLDTTERLSDRLADIGYLLLDEETKRGMQTAFDELSARIAQARRELEALEGRGAPPEC
ncbi:MAG TPA: hypothetical protein VFB31_06340 [Pseudolabrys sp.]|jgi:hypothetical protein|nr:hypothetical protein [Pseudolabrys sp.]